MAADVASFQLGPSHASPGPARVRLRSNLSAAPTVSGTSRIEAHSRELCSERLGLICISIP